MGKHSKVSPSTEWRLGQNVVLQPMECLTPTVKFYLYIYNYFTSVSKLLSRHLRVSLLYSLPECQGTPCSKQAPYLKFKWQQCNSNPQPISS